MVQVTVEQAKTRIDDLIELAASGQEVLIMEDNLPLARITHVSGMPDRVTDDMPLPRYSQNAKGTLFYIPGDHEAPIEELRDYR